MLRILRKRITGYRLCDGEAGYFLLFLLSIMAAITNPKVSINSKASKTDKEPPPSVGYLYPPFRKQALKRQKTRTALTLCACYDYISKRITCLYTFEFTIW